MGRVGGGYLLRPWPLHRATTTCVFLRDVQFGGDGDVDGGV